MEPLISVSDYFDLFVEVMVGIGLAFNLMLFAVPMVLLYFLGVLAAYLLVSRRDERGIPWKKGVAWAEDPRKWLRLFVWSIAVGIVSFAGDLLVGFSASRNRPVW